MKVTVGSFVLDADDLNGDSDGDVFAVDDIEGIDLQDVEVSTKNKASGGVCVTNVKLLGYNMTLSGHAFTPEPRNNIRLRNKIATAFNMIVATTMQVEFFWEDGFTMSVYRDGQMRVDLNGPNVIKFEIPLIAPDGVKTPIP